MKYTRQQSGFTAVELLITLFVAAAFLIASYQLFNLVIKDGGATRAQSRAANVAYDYLRQYAASSTTIPCTESTPLNNAAITVDGLSSVTMTIRVTCLPDAVSSLSKVEASVTYNAPPQTVNYATYVSSSGTATSTDVTNGLVAWWKLNGNANISVGSPNGTINNATSTTNKLGQNDMAYAFNGSNSTISTASTFGLGTANVSISCWIYNPTASNNGIFVHVGSSGYGVGMGNTTTDTVGTKLVMIFNGVRWIPTTTTIPTGWHHIVMVIASSGVPTAYVDGVSTGAYAGANALSPTANVTAIGSISSSIPANAFTGSIDDVRIYNRVLTTAEILSLYSAGAQ
jgi:Tfp pilus assembly protein PilE